MPKALRAVFLLQQINLDFFTKIVDTFKRRTVNYVEYAQREREEGVQKMYMSGNVKNEKEDFKKLYEGIQNDVVRERIRASGEWYIERATKYKRIFFILSAIGIIAPLLVTVIISAGLNSTKDGNDMTFRIVIAACSALASFSSTFMVVLKCKEKWTNYRNTVEQIKSELVYYSIDEGTDSERLKKLVDRTEKIMREEHGRWNEILMMQKIEETEPTEPSEKIKESQADSERM